MTSNQEPRTRGEAYQDEANRKAAKLAPAKKSGTEQYYLYGELDEEGDELYDFEQRESVLDYFDDEEQEDI